MQLKPAVTIAGVIAAAGAGAVAARQLIGDRDPWVWHIPGPGSIDQVPSMFAPWLLPATAAGIGSAALAHTGHGAAATAVGLGAAALYGAGFATWVTGMQRGDD
jgi:hypothetical protein